MDEREKEIRKSTQVDALLNNRKPTCNTTHHAGCDCQIHRYIREKFDLLSIIDRQRAEMASVREASKAINIVFNGAPSHTSGRFVEVELDDGLSIPIGEWVERADGYWALRIGESTIGYVHDTQSIY